MNPFQFQKMHGLGNDFVVINAQDQVYSFSHDEMKRLADRHLGIGFDQLLIVKPSKNADFYCQIFNSDASEAEQCGNGLRCVARFLHENKFASSNQLTIETKAGVFEIHIKDYDNITVVFPLNASDMSPLKLNEHEANVISLGNPHALIRVDDLSKIDFSLLGEKYSKDPQFKAGANIGFMQVIDKENIYLRTFERGAGLTHACGSNATAAVIVGVKKGWLNENVAVHFELGTLHIHYIKNKNVIEMCGPASKVFEGTIFG